MCLYAGKHFKNLWLITLQSYVFAHLFLHQVSQSFANFLNSFLHNCQDKKFRYKRSYASERDVFKIKYWNYKLLRHWSLCHKYFTWRQKPDWDNKLWVFGKKGRPGDVMNFLPQWRFVEKTSTKITKITMFLKVFVAGFRIFLHL